MFGISCYGGNLSVIHQKRIDRIIHKANKITKSQHISFLNLYSIKATKKARSIIEDPYHPLNNEYIKSGRSERFILKKCRTGRYKNSFIPSSIRKLSSSQSVNLN